MFSSIVIPVAALIFSAVCGVYALYEWHQDKLSDAYKRGQADATSNSQWLRTEDFKACGGVDYRGYDSPTDVVVRGGARIQVPDQTTIEGLEETIALREQTIEGMRLSEDVRKARAGAAFAAVISKLKKAEDAVAEANNTIALLRAENAGLGSQLLDLQTLLVPRAVGAEACAGDESRDCAEDELHVGILGDDRCDHQPSVDYPAPCGE